MMVDTIGEGIDFAVNIEELVLPQDKQGQTESTEEVLLRAGLLLDKHTKSSTPPSIVGEFMGGVSGAKVFLIKVSHPEESPVDGALPQFAVLKYQPNIVKDEDNARELINGYQRLPFEVHDDKGNFVVYEYIPGVKVNDIVIKDHDDERNSIYRSYVRNHADMWRQTNEVTDSVEGYPKKIKSTREVVERINIAGVTLGEEMDKDVILNGVNIGTLNQALEGMSSRIEKLTDKGETVISHGDENPDNCILSSSNELVMFDHTTAGRRIVQEPIAKILSWYLVTGSEHSTAAMYSESDKLEITTISSLDDKYIRAISAARDELSEWLETDDQKKDTAAAMMMYCLREIQWLRKRGRTEMAVHVLAMALDLYHSINTNEKIFPLHDTRDARLPGGINSELTESEKSRNITRLDAEDQIDDMFNDKENHIIQKLSHVKLVSFDLDGTVIGKNTVFPSEEIRQLKGVGVDVTFASGAGAASIEKKIASTGDTSLLSSMEIPVIANEGAQLVTFKDGQANITEEVALHQGEIADVMVAISGTMDEDTEFIGFYPTVESGQNPSQYIIYVNPESKNPEETVSDLETKYTSAVFTNSLDDYFQLLTEYRASKIVMKSSSDKAKEVSDKINLATTVMNEGYLNIVSGEVSKLTGLDRIGSHLEISRDQVTHFGNDDNDLDALIELPLSFVVDSNPEMTGKLLGKLKQSEGDTIVINPNLVPYLLRKMVNLYN